MTHFEIRQIFLDFFKEREHKVLPSSSLIPQNDPSLLFVNAGMNQFKSIILGLEKPPAKNVVTIQKCMRAGGKHNDLENVGQTFRHNTFFEMMGNFSFGGYFKQKAIALAWEFFTEKLKMNPEHLWISVYEKDEESYAIWRDEQRIPENKIYRMGEEDNFWRMGETGPCGPCTEIHYYKGKEKRPDPDQLMEFGNLVFMEFDDKGKGQREKLSVPCVDTGTGLERVCAILQNKQSIYHTDCFKGIIQSLEEASGCKYDFTEKSQSEKQMAFRVLADHSRAAAFLMSDGVLPGNEGQSYVLRRILRRAFLYSDRLNSKENLLSVASQKVIDLMGEIYTALKDAEVEFIIQGEAELFIESLKTGKDMLFKKMKDLPNKTIPDSLVWHLYSTYGFPPDLTRLITKEKGFEVSETFNLEKFKKKQQTSFLREVEKDLLRNFNRQYHPQKTEFITDRENSKITHLVYIGKPLGEPERNNNVLSAAHAFPQSVSFIKKESKNRLLIGGGEIIQDGQGIPLPEQPVEQGIDKQELWLITDKTCFYPGDQGKLKTDTGQAEVLGCEKEGDVIFHKVKLIKGELKKDQECKMEQDRKQMLEALSQLALKMRCQETKFTGYKTNEEEGRIILPGGFPDLEFTQTQVISGGGMFTGSKLDIAPSLKKGQTGWLLLDKTCFYPEGGGPVGDKGELKTETSQAEVLDCQKKGNFIFHKVKVKEGELEKGQSCKMKVDKKYRLLIKTGHSATHLLHQALRKELGASVRQAGSLVLPGKLRFDFTYSKSLTENQIEKIEGQVKKNIKSKNSVSDSEHSYEEAVQSGALYMAGENYPSQVRVITMGDSREFCGGIHVKNTSDIGYFKIISETGVQSGVRRITAYTSDIADNWLGSLARQNFNLRKYLQNMFGSQDEQKKSGSKAAPFAVMNENPGSNFVKSDQAGGDNPSDATEDAVSSPQTIKGVNPFIAWIKVQDEKIKQLKNQLKNLIPPDKRTGAQSKTFQSERILPSFLGDGESSLDYEKWMEQNLKHRDLLVEQILELRKYLKLPAPKDVELSAGKDGDPKEESLFIPLMRNKQEEIQSLRNQLENLPWDILSAEKLKKQAKPFHKEEVKGSLLVMDLPVTDRKILADMADQLKLKISSGVVVLLGDGKESWPLMVAVTKDLQQYISAGELMKKTITPLLGGKGGGQARFAQGTITNREKFPKLEKVLLQILHSVPSEKWEISEMRKSLRDIFVFPFRILWPENLSIRGSLAGSSFALAVLAGIYIFMLSDRQTMEKQTSSLQLDEVKREIEQWKKEERSQQQFRRKKEHGKTLTGEARATKGLVSTGEVLRIWVLTAEQIQALTTEEIQALTVDQIQILKTEQIQALTVEQIQELTADQIQVLTSKQIQSFTSEQAQALTSEQIQFLTSEQAQILTLKRKKAISPE